MKKELTVKQSALKIIELQGRLDDYEQLIEAIKGGEVDAFALTTNNQSEIFTLRSADYAYKILVENFSEGALNLSKEALIIYTNNYFTDLLNLPYENVIGNSFIQFIHPESKNTFKNLLKKGLKAKAKGEINLLVANKTIPIYISLTSLFPSIPMIGVIITDLTEKKKQEKILQMKNAELEKMNNELQAFGYHTSHDLQGPLRKVQTFVSRIIEKEENSLSKNGKDYLKRVQDEANRMQLLIQDLLAYSRTNTTERKFEKTDLSHVIDEVKVKLKEELKDTNAILEATELDKVHIIPFQFRQLMYNLIENTLKFSNPTKAPHIIIKSEIAPGKEFKGVNLPTQKKYCHISITDNGIGFDPQYSEKIFEIFFRLHDEAQYKGTGIGLAIVKKIVENHDGLIIAESKLDQGTTFHIYIPETRNK